MNGSHRQGHGFEHRRGHRQKDGHEENLLLTLQEENKDRSKEGQGNPGSKGGSSRTKNR